MNTETKREPVKYTVLEKSLVGNEIFEAGQTCEYDGMPSENLAPTCDVGRARYQEYLDSNKARVAKMRAENAESGVGDADAFAKAVTKALAESNAAHEAKFDTLAAAMTSMAETMAALAKAQTPAPTGKASKTPLAEPLV